MKVKEAIEQMSSMYLDRIVRSFMKEDIPKKDISAQRKEILNNVNTLADATSVKKRLDSTKGEIEDLYSERILTSLILKTLLSFDDLRADENALIEAVKEQEKGIVEGAKAKNAFAHLDKQSLDIFREVLKVALDDAQITQDEESLLRKLRSKLGINERDQYLIQSSLDLFPKEGNKLHTPKEIQKGLTHLQKCGIIFFCNQPKDSNEEPFFVLPEEVSKGVKAMMGIELVENKFRLLLQRLTMDDLANALDEKGLQVSGKKEDRIERILRAGIKPSEVLDQLDSGALADFCGKLPGLKKSGKKDQKIQEVIDYFDALVNKEKGEGDDQRKTYYNFFEQLASRDYSNLRGQEVIEKDVEIDGAFEQATHYLFTEICGMEVMEMDGKKTPDGMLKDPADDNEVLLWDNKSQEGPYTFPESHKKQFGDYISKYKKKGYRIKSFLIITQSIDDSAQKNARLLKNQTDVDVALISAEDLKYVAENWKKYARKKGFDPNVFNDTGILSREVINQMMEWIYRD